MSETEKKISRSATTDLELVQVIKNNSGEYAAENAYRKLFNKYNDTMVFHFRKFVKNDEETARELVHKAFIKMSSNIGKFNEETAVFSTWLYRLTQNIFIDNLRKKKEELVYFSELSVNDENNEYNDAEFDVEDPSGTPETAMLVVERNDKMNEIIEKMKNKKLAEVVKMRFFEGMSYEEISKNTLYPLGTVKAFLFRAREILKDEFELANIFKKKAEIK